MSFTNINDPAGVRALLDRLRTSQAWQDTLAVPTEPDDSFAHEQANELSSSSASPSVAMLLSQLQSDSSTSPVPVEIFQQTTPLHSDSPQYAYESALAASAANPHGRHSPRKDTRSMTFQQALPRIASLAEDPSFAPSIAKIREDQERLEKALWDERLAIRTKHEEKVKLAKAKANIIGSGLSKHEVDMMSDAFKREISKFELERVLPAWDGLVTKQQADLEALGVPTMFPSEVATDRERQHRVMQVLEGVLRNDEDA